MLSWALTEQLDVAEEATDDSALELPGYDLLGLLGRGGMGAVYRAKEHKFDRVVALKVFTARGRDQELFLQRLRREGRLMAKLEHPNVLGIYEASVLDDGTPYLALEYVEGEDLQKRLQERKKLKIKEAIRIAVNVCNGLSAVHALGIIHRDIKPANVLLGVDGAVKVTDFGVSKEFREGENTSLTMTGTAIGTVDYMAPEQSKGEALDERADIYSVGVLLYEMISGVTPRGAFESLARHGVSKELDKLVMRCLQRDPMKRPASAANLALQLKKIYKKISARRRRDQSGKWYAAAAGLAALGVFAMFAAREMRPAAPQTTLTKLTDEPPQKAPHVWIDLAAAVDVKADTRSGQWWKYEQSLVCSAQEDAQLLLQSVQSEEYIVESEFTRVSGDGAVVFRLPTSLGVLSMQFSSTGVSVAELLQIESKVAEVTNGEPQKVKIKVTADSVICYTNGLLVARWDFEDLESREHTQWGRGEAKRLALAVECSEVIFRMTRLKQM